MIVIYVRLRERCIDQIIRGSVLIGEKILRFDLIIGFELIHLCIIESERVNIF